MAIAGFCRQCNQNVWCDAQGNCANGHPVSEVSNWYDPDTGQRFDFGAPVAQPQAAQAPGMGAAVVAEIAQALRARLETARVEVGDGDGGSPFEEALREGGTDAARGAGDDGARAGDLHDVLPSQSQGPPAT